MNINEYHWLVHQPITLDFQHGRSRYYTNCPSTPPRYQPVQCNR